MGVHYWYFGQLRLVAVAKYAYQILWVAVPVEKPMHVYFLLHSCLITAAMFVNSAEMSLYTTAFLASCVVAVEMENNDGVIFLAVDGCFPKVTSVQTHLRRVVCHLLEPQF